MNEQTQAYRDFFKESQAGSAFVTKLQELITQQHEKASKTLDMQESFAHTQRAEGINDVLSQINSLCGGIKK